MGKRCRSLRSCIGAKRPFPIFASMMVFPDSFEQKLGFDSIRQILLDHCLSPLGRQRVDKISFSADAETIHHQLSLTAEMKKILEFAENFPAQDYYDMIPLLLHLRIEGCYPETEQLSELKLSLNAITRLLNFFEKNKEEYPELFQLGMRNEELGIHEELSIHLFQSVAYKIAQIVDERSQIRDTASPALLKLRKEKASKLVSVEKKVVQSFKLARKNGWTPEDAEITIRNGRMVIPLTAANKRKIPGFLHDESATGQTAYIEPAEIFETNNEIREIGYAEQREITRILIELANFIRPDIDPLIKAYLFLGEIDFIRAKARFAMETGGNALIQPVCRMGRDAACLPDSQGYKMQDKIILNPESGAKRPCIGSEATLHQERSDPASFSWRGAIHPLLFLSHKKQGKNVVPLDISLDQTHRILVISGPNAGGKSVCLKTVGLVQYMYQCGLLPTVKEDSELCIFSKIFIDIGDEQSIDNDLSTYTSKLYNLKYFLENLNHQSLFLIDELGTGTDPSLGGAIAEASLEKLNTLKSFGIVTTHYSNLKLLAGKEEGILNGAMLFDLKNLKPLYQLKIGKPGSSFAFEIASEIGFPREVIDNAQSKTGRSQLDFDRELQNLEVEKEALNKQSTELNVADKFLSEVIAKYEKLTAELEAKKKEILETAREEARELLANSNKIIEKTIKEIREAQAEKGRTKEVRAELKEVKEKMDQDAGYGIQDTRSRMQEKTILNPGSRIPDPGSVAKRPYQGYIDDLHAKLLNFELTLDLRGKRVDEALALLQRYIDDATLLSLNEVRILHGKGNGVLRQITRDYLRSRKEIRSVRDEALERGGPGVTLVSF